MNDRTWHETDMPMQSLYVRYQGMSRPSSDATDGPLRPTADIYEVRFTLGGFQGLRGAA